MRNCITGPLKSLLEEQAYHLRVVCFQMFSTSWGLRLTRANTLLHSVGWARASWCASTGGFLIIISYKKQVQVLVESVFSERGLLLWEKILSVRSKLHYPPNLVVGTIFNHSSSRHAILQNDFFGLKDRWPIDSTT